MDWPPFTSITEKPSKQDGFKAGSPPISPSLDVSVLKIFFYADLSVLYLPQFSRTHRSMHKAPFTACVSLLTHGFEYACAGWERIGSYLAFHGLTMLVQNIRIMPLVMLYLTDSACDMLVQNGNGNGILVAKIGRAHV